MKIWKGPEMEGPDKGAMTLFIKDEYPSGLYIIDMLDENPECTRLYLGAGRTDVIGLWPTQPNGSTEEATNEFGKLIRHCNKKKIQVVMEVSLEGYAKVPDFVFEECDQIIVRIQNKLLNDLRDSDCIKVDDEKNVRVISLGNMHKTTLDTLYDNIFTDVDIILFNNEEEDNESNSSTN